MPLHERQVATYHADDASASPSGVLGKQALLSRYPWVSSALFSAASKLFPVAITRSWADRSGDSAQDPLLRQALPDPSEWAGHPLDRPDPVGDRAQSPVPWLVQKHPDRALLLVTKRCHLYCRFCFRRDHKPGEALDPTPAELDRAINAAVASGAREIILSGGDPLSLSNGQLDSLLRRLRPNFKVIRIHSRAPITCPERVDSGLIRALQATGPVWMVLHCNHPDELSTDALSAIKKLRMAGIGLLNQTVLLKGINDTADTLAALSEALVEIGVKPYYLHHTDPVPGNGHFRVRVEKGLALHQALKARLSGVALPAYVVDLPDGSGKIPVNEAHQRGLIR
jgi:lysine 2,3-aminomutase